MFNFFSEKFGHFFWSFFRAQEIPHLSVINFMMKPPNPAQKFLQNILFKTENYYGRISSLKNGDCRWQGEKNILKENL